ncbi:MAG: CDP-glucose 4,6-dehydratase [Candidatus Aminicenantales bacterium]
MIKAAAVLEKCYKNKRVLVTGHTGFKGSWLSLWLKELGAEVIGYGLDPCTPLDNFVLSHLSGLMVDIRGDIRDQGNLQKVFRKYSPEFVFHLAAQPLVREGYRNPKETVEVNIGGTVNVLENCRFSESVKVIINVTSDKCYENREWIWGYRENDRLGGYDPYSSSKACSEILTAAWRNSFFNPNKIRSHGKSLSSVRAGNVIGGGDWRKDRIIPDCIHALENKKPIEIRNPRSTRPWQYVLEPLGGYLLLGAFMANAPQKYCGAWNFGPETSSIISVQKLVELVIRHWGAGKWRPIKEKSKPHEAGLLALDTRKAHFELGWKSCLEIEEAVLNTVIWYKTAHSKGNIRELCDNQIQEYMKKMPIQ